MTRKKEPKPVDTGAKPSKKYIGVTTSDARWAARMAALAEISDNIADWSLIEPGDRSMAKYLLPEKALTELIEVHKEYPFLRPVIEKAVRDLAIDVGNAVKQALADAGFVYNGVDGSSNVKGIRNDGGTPTDKGV